MYGLKSVAEKIQQGKHDDARELVKADEFRAELKAGVWSYLNELPRETKLCKCDEYKKETQELSKSYWNETDEAYKKKVGLTGSSSKNTLSQSEKKSNKDYKSKVGLTGFFAATISAFVPQAMRGNKEEFNGAVRENFLQEAYSGSHNDDLQEYYNWAIDNPEVATDRIVAMIDRIATTGEVLGDILPVLLPTIAFWSTLMKGGKPKDAIYNAALSAFYGVVGREIALFVATNVPGATNLAADVAFVPAFEILKADIMNDVGSHAPNVAGGEGIYPWQQDTASGIQDAGLGAAGDVECGAQTFGAVACANGGVESGAQFGEVGYEECCDVEVLCCLWDIITFIPLLIIEILQCVLQVLFCFLI